MGIQALRYVLRGGECKPKRVCGCARSVVGLRQRVMGELGHPHTIRGGAYCASGRIMGALWACIMRACSTCERNVGARTETAQKIPTPKG